MLKIRKPTVHIIISCIFLLCCIMVVIFEYQKYYTKKYTIIHSKKEIIISGYNNIIWYISFSKQGSMIAIAGGDGLLMPLPPANIININTGQLICELNSKDHGIVSIKFLDDSKYIIINYTQNSFIYNMVTHIYKKLLLCDVTSSENGKLLCGLENNQYVIFNRMNSNIITRLKWGYHADISPNGMFVAVTHKGYVSIYSMQKHKLLYDIKLPWGIGSTDGEFVKFSHTGNYLVVGHNRTSYIIANVKKRMIIKYYRSTSECEEVYFSNHDNYFLSIAKYPELYNLHTVKLNKRFTNLQTFIRAASFVPDQRKIAFATGYSITIVPY